MRTGVIGRVEHHDQWPWWMFEVCFGLAWLAVDKLIGRARKSRYTASTRIVVASSIRVVSIFLLPFENRIIAQIIAVNVCSRQNRYKSRTD